MVMKTKRVGFWKGKKLSLETRTKMSATRKGVMKKNGVITHQRGYRCIFSPDHPNKDGKGYVFEHRLVMEAHLGRTLLKTEVVHHINGLVKDNRIENLMLFTNQSEHRKHHIQLRKNKNG